MRFKKTRRGMGWLFNNFKNGFLNSDRNVIFVNDSMSERNKRRTEYVVPDRNTEF